MTTAINPDPHASGYRFNPKYRVTALYGSREHLQPLLESLHAAGFADQEIAVFVGGEGAEKLDVSGEHHGKVVQFLREAQLATADEEYLFKELDETVRKGGVVVSISTGGDDAKKKKAVELLKANDAHEVYYWGQWSIEHF